MREHPIGFEKDRRNIFDPEEDQPSSDDAVDQDKKVQSVANQNDTEEQSRVLREPIATATTEVHVDEETTSKEKTPPVCARKNCTRKPRFDSLFCSDSCGVSSLELDLLFSFQESSDIHPAILRN